MTTVWGLIAFAAGAAFAAALDLARGWLTQRRLTRLLAGNAARSPASFSAMGRHAAGAGAPPRDRLDELLDEQAAGACKPVPPVTGDPMDWGWERPSQILPKEFRPLRPLPMPMPGQHEYPVWVPGVGRQDGQPIAVTP